jgi:ADP-ribosylglycohydrolase
MSADGEPETTGCERDNFTMLGAIGGDIIGSVHEYRATKSPDFELFVAESTFTDDTVLSVAVADCLLNGREYVDAFHEYFLAYPDDGYGLRFFHWAMSGRRDPYNSFGNGSAMRVAAVGHAFGALDDVLAEAARSAEVTHNHPEGVKGAQATAMAVFMARQRDAKHRIKDAVERRFGYDLGGSVDDLRQTYQFDESCQGTVPAAILAFLESRDYEDAVRKAVSWRRCGSPGVYNRRHRGSALRRRSVPYRHACTKGPGRSLAPGCHPILRALPDPGDLNLRDSGKKCRMSSSPLDHSR